MNFKTTFVLLLLVIGVGAYLIFVSLPNTTTYEQIQLADQSGDDGRPIFRADEFSTASVTKITIRQGEKEPIVFSKDGADWWQTKPVRFPLNTWSTERIVDDAAGLKYAEKTEPGKNGFPGLKDLSFDPPLATLVLEGDDEKTTQHTIRLGHTGLGGRGYVMVNDDPHVYVVSGDLHKKILEDSINEWRKKSMSGPDESEADQVVLTRGEQSIELLKSEGNWVFGAKHSGRVSRDGVKDLLKAVDDLYIHDFVADQPDSLARYGLEKPRTIVKIRVPVPKPADTQPSNEGEDKEELVEPPPAISTLKIGAPQDLKKERFFATYVSSKDEGIVVFTIAKTGHEKFDKSTEDLRDKRITPIVATDVAQYLIQRTGGDAIQLERDPDGWAFAEPGPGYGADHDEVSKQLEAIVEAEAESFTPDFQPAADPTATITLTATGRPEPDVLRLYVIPDDDEHCIVQRNNETTGYHVPLEKIESLFEPVLSLRHRMVLDLSVENVASLAIHHPGGTLYQFQQSFPQDAVTTADETVEPLEADEPEKAGADQIESDQTQPVAIQPVVKGVWTLAGAEKFEQNALDDLMEQLLPLKAESWLQTEPSISGFMIRIVTTDDRTIEILIDPENRAASATNVADVPFEVSDELTDALNEEFRHRTVLPIGPDQIESIAVTHESRTITVMKDGADYLGSQGEKIDDSAAGGLFDTIAHLRVKRYVPSADTTQPTHTIEVRTKDDQTHHLVIASEGATLGDRAFTLEEDTLEKLQADLLEKDEDKNSG